MQENLQKVFGIPVQHCRLTLVSLVSKEIAICDMYPYDVPESLGMDGVFSGLYVAFRF